MALVSVTRLHLRAIRFLLPFSWYVAGSARQARRAAGNLGVQLRKTKGLAFCTLTMWQDEAAMKTFRGNSPHREAMQKLAGWCDEASFAHWEQDSTAWPSWEYASEQLRSSGRLSKVLHPSENHNAGRIVTN